MRRLLFISGYWPTKKNTITGIFIVEQIRALCRLGHHITVVVPRTLGRFDKLLGNEELSLPSEQVLLLMPKVLRFPESISHYRSIFSLNIFLNGIILSRYLRENVDILSLDACIIHGLRYSGLSVGVWGERICAPKCLIIHGKDPFFEICVGSTFFSCHIKKSINKIEKIIVVGRSLLEYLEYLGVDLSKVDILFNGTEVPDISQTEPPEMQYERAKSILSVSNLNKSKGVQDTLVALSILKRRYGITKWVYRIVGDGPEHKNLLDLTIKLGLSEHVEFLGRLTRKETLEEFENCDLFCLPSWIEAFGIVYLEAMVRMKPIIACNSCGPADFVTHDYDGILVPPKTPENLALAIKQLWDNPEKMNKIAQQARKTAETFTWDANAIKLLEILGVG